MIPTMERTDKKEGRMAKMMEEQAAKLPSNAWLYASLTCMSASLGLMLMGKKHAALFIGQWAAPFLLFGIYNKIVKVAGHDRSESDSIL